MHLEQAITQCTHIIIGAIQTALCGTSVTQVHYNYIHVQRIMGGMWVDL
jgi:hypothetical protein